MRRRIAFYRLRFIAIVSISVSDTTKAASLPREPPEQKRPQHDKQNVGKPDEQLRVRMRVSAQGIPNDHEQKIRCGNNQTHGEPDRSFAPMGGNAQRHPDDCERHTREWK